MKYVISIYYIILIIIYFNQMNFTNSILYELIPILLFLYPYKIPLS